MSRKKCIETRMLRKKGFHPVVLTQIIAAILHKKMAFETRSNLTLHFSQAQCTHTMGRDQFCRGILISIQPSFQCQYLAHRIQQPIPKLRIQMFTNFTICFYFLSKAVLLVKKIVKIHRAIARSENLRGLVVLWWA